MESSIQQTGLGSRYEDQNVRCSGFLLRRYPALKPASMAYSGRSTLSPDGLRMVVSNLADGFDCYSTTDHTRTHTYPLQESDNLPLPALFVHDGRNVVLGSTSGRVQLASAKSSAVVSVLQHSGAHNSNTALIRLTVNCSGGYNTVDCRCPSQTFMATVSDICRSKAYVAGSDCSYIATGTAERGRETSVWIWRSVLTSNPEVVRAQRVALLFKLKDAAVATGQFILGWGVLLGILAVSFAYKDPAIAFARRSAIFLQEIFAYVLIQVRSPYV